MGHAAPLRVNWDTFGDGIGQFYDGDKYFGAIERDPLRRPGQGWDVTGQDVFHRMPIVLACPYGPRKMAAVLNVNGHHVLCTMPSPEVTLEAARYFVALEMALDTEKSEKYVRPKGVGAYPEKQQDIEAVSRLISIFGALHLHGRERLSRVLSEVSLKGYTRKDATETIAKGFKKSIAMNDSKLSQNTAELVQREKKIRDERRPTNIIN